MNKLRSMRSKMPGDHKKTTVVKEENEKISNPDQMIEAIEDKLFKSIETPVERAYVNISNDNKIWTLSANTKSENTPIVILHGLCAGIGMWLHIIDKMAAKNPFYAIDLLGFGRSSRPAFSEDPVEAERQFVDSIEEWRKEMKIEQMILFGHSFGGYLATSYSLRFADRVKALVLIDPWGFSENPKIHTTEAKPIWFKIVNPLSQAFSPLALIRATGPRYVSIYKYLRPDFKKNFMGLTDDADIIYNYLYYANCQEPTGELAFRTISECLVYAKYPMIKRIKNISHRLPIYFIYGSNSWIESRPGFESISLRKSEPTDQPQTYVKVIFDAGHHVYADKSTEFNEFVQDILLSINIAS